MEENYKLSEILKEIREFTFQILDKNSDINVYTNIGFSYRIEKNIKKVISKDQIQNIDIEALFLASYMFALMHANNNIKHLDFFKLSEYLDVVVLKIREKFTVDDTFLDKAKTICIQALPVNKAELKEAQILNDAIVMDFACPQGRERMKLMYEQLILRDHDLSKSNWYDIIINNFKKYETYTFFGKNTVQPLINELLVNLKKERKEIENTKSLLVQKELQISDAEIKQLKKGLLKIKNRDDRGIQTLFRNTSRNHYKLNQMIDGKARIMITVNSIILSLIIGNFIKTYSTGFIDNIPLIIITIASIVSITFSIISITPNKTQGNFTEEEIRSKKGNLLYFGNFYNMHYRDFEWAFLQLLQDKDYLYSSMIKDFYYQGQVLHRKNTSIRISLYVFLFGLAATILTQLFLKFQ